MAPEIIPVPLLGDFSMPSVLGRRQQGVGQCFAKQPLFFGIRGGEAVTGAAKLQIPGRDNDNDTARPEQ